MAVVKYLTDLSGIFSFSWQCRPERMDPRLRTQALRLTLLWSCYKLVDTVLSLVCPGSSGRARVCGCDLCRGTADGSVAHVGGGGRGGGSGGGRQGR